MALRHASADRPSTAVEEPWRSDAGAETASSPLVRAATSLETVGKLGVLAVLLVTAAWGVVVPRGLYADGAYNLWLVLNTEGFVFIGPARTFAIFLNQLPVVTAMHLGVRDLDVLIGFYSFGVAAVPVLIWALALAIQFRGRLFWPLAVLYSTAFLTSGFIAIGEYTYAFALSALIVSILMSDGPLRRRLAAPLVVASTALILAYEGMSFLGLPLLALAAIRLARRSWLTREPEARGERIIVWYALVCAVLSIGVGAASIGIRMMDSADTNLAGAMNVRFALETNRQWQVAFAVAVLFLLSLAIRSRWPAIVVRVAVGVGAASLLRESLWAPAWLHYNTRSLSTYTFAFLLVLLLVVVILDNVRGRATDASAAAPPDQYTGTGKRDPLARLALAAGVSVLVGAMSLSFVTMTKRYGDWLGNLEAVVRAGDGPMEISETTLYTGPPSQFSWGWTNPYLSALLQTEPGQGIVLSHVETLETYTGITPPPSLDFFRTYHRSETD